MLKGVSHPGEYVCDAYSRIESKKTYFVENILGNNINSLTKETASTLKKEGFFFEGELEIMIKKAKETLRLKALTDGVFSGEYKFGNMLYVIYRLNTNFVTVEFDDFVVHFNKDSNPRNVNFNLN